MLALRSRASLHTFASEHGISQAQADEAIHKGLVRALDDADAAGALPGLVSSIARRVIETVQPWRLIDVLEQLKDLLP